MCQIRREDSAFGLSLLRSMVRLLVEAVAGSNYVEANQLTY